MGTKHHRGWWVAAIVGLISFSSWPNSAPAQGVTANKPVGDAPLSSSNASTIEQADPLLATVEEAIAISTRRYLDADVHTPWQIMHGILALRFDFQLKKNGEKINAMDWISTSAKHRGVDWFEKTQYGGRAHPFSQAYVFEGHANQFLAIFSMADVPPEHEFKAGDATIRLSDMIEHAKREVHAGEEFSWTLWGLSHYLEPDATWTNKRGETWNIESLVRLQVDAPVHSGPCGGTHGMFALSLARNEYLYRRKPLRGVWLEADQKIRRYVEEARATQNSDGTFSSYYLRGPAHSSDFGTRLATSGHVLEFIMVAVPEQRLREPWLRNAVKAVAQDLIDNRRAPAECGALYHALDALVIYRDRVKPRGELAKQDPGANGNTENAAVDEKGSGVGDQGPGGEGQGPGARD